MPDTPRFRPTSDPQPNAAKPEQQPEATPPRARFSATTSERVELELAALENDTARGDRSRLNRLGLLTLLLILLAPSAWGQERTEADRYAGRTTQLMERLAQRADAPPTFPTTEIALRQSSGKVMANAVVNTTVYERDGSCSDGDCSIVDALEAASGGGTVTFDPSLNGATITFNTAVGTPAISGVGTIVIDASALADKITFSGNDVMPLLSVSGGADVIVKGVTFANGARLSGFGGAISVEESTLTLESCTVKQSRAGRGGAVSVFDGNLNVLDSTIEDNVAESRVGGGIQFNGNFRNTSLLIENSIIQNNTAASYTTSDGFEAGGAGGGVSVFVLPASPGAGEIMGTVTIRNSQILNNVAELKEKFGRDFISEGGGLDIYGQVNAVVESTTISGNLAAQGGGVYISSLSARFEDVDLFGNKAGLYGGGIYNTFGFFPEEDERAFLDLIDSSVYDNQISHTFYDVVNTAMPEPAGGGVANIEGTVEINGSTVYNNKGTVAFETDVELRGGGLFTTSYAKVENSTFYNNEVRLIASQTSSAQGGSIYGTERSRVEIVNSTIYAGLTTGYFDPSEPSEPGVDVYLGGVGNSLTSSVLVKEQANQLACRLAPGASIVENAYMFISDGTCNTVEGGTPTAFLSGDPLLGALADNGGPTQTLLPGDGSPLIDAGSCAGVTEDQRGETRPYDAVDSIYSNADDGCDIGAVEVQRGEIEEVDCDGTCYVNASAAGTGDGSSWTDAFTTVQTALAAADSGDQIWVADGTYYPDEGFSQTDGDRASTFQLETGVALYGGFAGGETTLDQRDIAANPAILSGDLDQNDGADFANNGENAYHVVTGSGADNTALLDGFTVRAGYADGSGSLQNNGGGILNDGGSPTIRRSTITGNAASFAGGGIANRNASSPVITQSLIASNTAPNGGGLFSFDSSAPVITSSTIAANTATSNGGSMVFGFCNGATPVITGSTITDNAATNNGGGISNQACSPQITSTILHGNSDSGGTDATAQIANSNSGATPTVSYSLVQGGLSSGTIDGGDNLDADPLLGALADNGGPTLTMLPADNSPTVDAGSCAGQTTDQRGETRPFDADDGAYPNADDGCDIGAVEIEVFAPMSFVVTTTADSGDGVCDVAGTSDGCTLREAITAANANGASDTIAFAPSVAGIIELSSVLPSLGISVAIVGPGADVLTIRRGTGGDYGIFRIAPDQVVTISGLTLTNGAGFDLGASTIVGGAIYNDGGTLTLEVSTISGNTAGEGGGIYNAAIRDPDTFELSGGILTVTTSTLSGNTGVNTAGGIYNDGGTVTVEASTLSGNASGAISSFGGSVTAMSSTFSGNTSSTVGGISSFGTLRLGNTVFDGNGQSISGGPVTSFGYNLCDDDCGLSEASDITSTPALLGPLQDNGGPTLTQLPTEGSPLVDAGSCGDLSIEQRGEMRPVNLLPSQADDGCDIGAVEAQSEAELPVELTAFAATQDGSRALLTWQTASETNNAGFHVEHQAPDAPDFADAGFVEGAGTTLEAQAYVLPIMGLVPGVHRFRLRQTDLDGTTELSPVVELAVEMTENYLFTAPRPNPSRTSARISLAVREAQQVDVSVYDALGRRVLTAFSGSVPASQTQGIRVDSGRLPAGLYFVRVEGETFVATRTLTVVR